MIKNIIYIHFKRNKKNYLYLFNRNNIYNLKFMYVLTDH